MRKQVKISEARQRLFELVDEVTSGAEPVVYIQHRDRSERAALVSEAHLRYLEARVAALAATRGQEFKLAGSMTLARGHEGVPETLAQQRAQQARRVAEKFSDLIDQ